MRGVRTVVLVVGVLVALSGLLWMAQGAGYFPYPASSFMIDQHVWVIRGLATLVVGVLVAAGSRWL